MATAVPAPSTALLAALLCAAAADLAGLTQLAADSPHVFTPTVVLRLLFCLPETVDPALYAPLLKHILAREPIGPRNDGPSKIPAIAGVSEKSAKRRVTRLLPPLRGTADSPEELVAAFLIARAEQIDSETGALSIAESLLRHDEFLTLTPVRHFYDGVVIVLSKLVYRFARTSPGLSTFRRLPLNEVIGILLAEEKHIVRDLDELVVPYLSVRDEQDWNAVWEKLSDVPFSMLVDVVVRWNPPEDVKSGFASTAIGGCYRATETGREIWDGMHAIRKRIGASIERRISSLMKGGQPGTEDVTTELGNLGDPGNRLFVPTTASLMLLDLMIASAAILGRPLAETLRVRLHGSSDIQMAVLKQYVHANPKQNEAEWRKTRDNARWLRGKSGVLGKLAVKEVEKIILAGMLTATRFDVVREIYVAKSTLPLEDVEKGVLEAFGGFYDNASNGNKTRGHMKNAFQTLQLLYPHTSKSHGLEAAYKLVEATNALSTYSLTLSPGVPLLPVQIRIHPDPVSLISRLLDSNRGSYLQPDVLVSIAQNLTTGTSSATPLDVVEARVVAMATEAALGEDDFETAYAYVTTRLLPSSAAADEVLWRTALAAGRWRSTYAVLSNAPPRGPVALRLLEKKMELLSLALNYCPREVLADVLEQWRRAEDEVDALLDAEVRAEQEHAALLGGPMPGTAAARTVAVAQQHHTGPQSLFEVAKGAATVFSGRGRKPSRSNPPLSDQPREGSTSSADERTRKRDVVSGMVTQGLASGLGWVLGAKPNLPEQQ